MQFHQLTREEIGAIVEMQTRRLAERLREKGVAIELTDGATTLIGNLGYDPTYGARPLKRVIQKQLIDKLALKLLEGEFGRATPSSWTPPTASSFLEGRSGRSRGLIRARAAPEAAADPVAASAASGHRHAARRRRGGRPPPPNRPTSRAAPPSTSSSSGQPTTSLLGPSSNSDVISVAHADDEHEQRDRADVDRPAPGGARPYQIRTSATTSRNTFHSWCCWAPLDRARRRKRGDGTGDDLSEDDHEADDPGGRPRRRRP